jgi:hypothetical protein
MLLTTPTGTQVEFTQGDDVTLTFLATDDLGNPQNLTGASLSTQVLGVNIVGPIVFPNSQHTLLNQSTNTGQFTLAFANAGADTTNCAEGASKQVLTTAVIAGVQTTYRGNNLLTVYPNVPLQ